ncbi:hypothetical protein [Sporomusa sp. KB1]|uniref:hypothetical protein n=1 Tax=Sporomusa sp. KB1 TaxID=943346 RepID=UPI0011AA24C0|nr:hypothetical protein [Sporomusa sp. KB1]TWH48462.1 hypothetical protein Salpa_4616 [Sporomusa sp. KB1]
MPLTRKEKQRIYEEELERIKARERIQAARTRTRQPKSSGFMNWVIVLGFLLMLYIVLGGK